MQRLYARWTGRGSTWALGVLLGQALLCVGLLLVGAFLWLQGNHRAALLMGLVPVAFLPFSYARLRLHRFVEPRFSSRAAIASLTIGGLLFDAIMVAQLLTARDSPGGELVQAAGISWIGAVWFSAHALFLLGAFLWMSLRLGARPLRRILPRAELPMRMAGGSGDEMLGRRELLRRAGLVGASVPFGVSLSGVAVSYDFQVESHEIVLPGWPRQLDGLRLVHLSDIHVGGLMNRERLAQVVDLTNACDPDLVLHTGDFLTHRRGDFDRPLYEALSRIRCRYGQWACLGNHDFDFVERFVQRLGQAGVNVLRNRAAVVAVGGREIEICGLDFVFQRAARPEVYADIVSTWPPRTARPRLLLNHDPLAFADLPADCADLVLSGHTHGGHIGIQLGKERALTVVGLAGWPDQGVFRRGGMRMFVTRCVGFYGYPIRLGIPPEIALLTLRAPASPPAAA